MGLREYDTHGRLRSADTADELHALLIDDWWDAQQAQKPDGSRQEVLMLTSRRREAHLLNDLARGRLLQKGLLGDDEVVVDADGLGQRAFAVGDEVLVVKNTYERDLLNGMRAIVTAVDASAGCLTLVTQGGKAVVLDNRHLIEGRLDYGYAATTHKAQGVTVDVALVLGTRAMTREAGYVGVSRGRAANYVYALTGETASDCGSADRTDTQGRSSERVTELASTMGRVSEKRLASESRLEPERQRVQALDVAMER